MIHPTEDALNDLLDGAGWSGERTREHLALCTECRLRFERLQSLNVVLRGLGADRAPEHFTERTMERLRQANVSSFAWSVLRNVAPLLALACVLTVLVGVYGSSSAAMDTPTYAPVASRISSWLQEAGAWLVPLLSGDVLPLTVSVLGLFAAVGIVDRYVLMRLWRR